MRWGLLALCACNTVFGLERTHNDQPPPDAHLQCPMLGMAPAFTPLLTQVGTKACMEYTESRSANLAMGYCYDDPPGIYIEAGPIGGDLKQTGIVPGATETFSNPRLAADGDRLTVISTDSSTIPYQSTVKVFRRDGTTWTLASTLAIPISSVEPLSPITNGATHRMLAGHINVLTEYDADSGSALATYMPSDLGYASVGAIGNAGTTLSLSPDGLRLAMLAEPSAGARRCRRARRLAAVLAAAAHPGGRRAVHAHADHGPGQQDDGLRQRVPPRLRHGVEPQLRSDDPAGER